ncbi:Aste57867_12431 [Aphanomyces stellatus]|uniref:Aste57867_12431 protein n=1 Tax=Aphanomyces stellatus TaxID=120398 RepID=A0A485KW01_9STRA|nr:hypothetical protein As57867_012385 [Aphanomyces stellatus]VFT89282.1 Aste57867_12431 [Aphanomyces stellatus]
MDEGLAAQKYGVVEMFYRIGHMKVTPTNLQHDGRLLLECMGPYLCHDTAMKFLLLDLPVELNHGHLVTRKSHLQSWSMFMDTSGPVADDVRRRGVRTILTQDLFLPFADEFLRDMAFTKDKYGREVIQITDAETRKYLFDRLYFCGRYEIFDGPPLHVSKTAVVVMAHDHGICTQLFQNHSIQSSVLDENDFICCSQILGRLSMDRNSTQSKKHEREIDPWRKEFAHWDKDKCGLLTEKEFLAYCSQQFGGKLKVAL